MNCFSSFFGFCFLIVPFKQAIWIFIVGILFYEFEILML